MVKRIKKLNYYQKGLLLVMLFMVIIFFIAYSVTISRVGFDYDGTILVPSYENESTVYSGKLKGQKICFTVSENKTVTFQYGDKSYGPYTAKEDSSAIPPDMGIPIIGDHMTGVELLQGNSVLFRGGVSIIGNRYMFYNEDGTLNDFENAEEIDLMAPPISAILNLMNDPELTHKGEWSAWFGAVFLCILNALAILFADELFRFSLIFQIRNVDKAEPSDWEIAGRYITWTVLPVIALGVLIVELM